MASRRAWTHPPNNLSLGYLLHDVEGVVIRASPRIRLSALEDRLEGVNKKSLIMGRHMDQAPLPLYTTVRIVADDSAYLKIDL